MRKVVADSPAAVRGYLTFDWTGGRDHPDPKDPDAPPGGVIARALADGLARAGLKPIDQVDHDSSYGWDFNVRADDVRIWLMLQKSDRWLLISEPRPTLWRRLVGPRLDTDTPHRRVCEVLDQVVAAIPEISAPRWYSEKEFEERGSGSEHP
jgi:hypothetical protein